MQSELEDSCWSYLKLIFFELRSFGHQKNISSLPFCIHYWMEFRIFSCVPCMVKIETQSTCDSCFNATQDVTVQMWNCLSVWQHTSMSLKQSLLWKHHGPLGTHAFRFLLSLQWKGGTQSPVHPNQDICSANVRGKKDWRSWDPN